MTSRKKSAADIREPEQDDLFAAWKMLLLEHAASDTFQQAVDDSFENRRPGVPDDTCSQQYTLTDIRIAGLSTLPENRKSRKNNARQMWATSEKNLFQ